jgi:hypothetical protein
MKSDLDFNKLFGRIRDIDQGKKPVTESSIAECGMMSTPMNNIPSAPPVSMSVNLNAQGIDQIKSLLDLMHKAESPLAAGPVGSPMMPQPPMPTMAPPAPMGMPALTLDEPGFGGEPEKGMDPLDALVKKAGIAMAPKAPSGDKAGEKSPIGSKEPAPKDDMKKVADEVRGMADTLADENQDGGFGDATTAPDEKYGDISTVTATGDDLASKGGEAPKKNGGGNPMESIRAQLDARYREIKESKSKPDFLDMDKDGDKKEPMKKAVKDKKIKEAEDQCECDDLGQKECPIHSDDEPKNNNYQKKVAEAFPTVASAKKDAEGTAGMKAGEKKKSSTGGTIEKTKTGIKHTAGKNYSGKAAENKTMPKGKVVEGRVQLDEGMMDKVKNVLMSKLAPKLSDQEKSKMADVAKSVLGKDRVDPSDFTLANIKAIAKALGAKPQPTGESIEEGPIGDFFGQKKVDPKSGQGSLGGIDAWDKSATLGEKLTSLTGVLGGAAATIAGLFGGPAWLIIPGVLALMIMSQVGTSKDGSS